MENDEIILSHLAKLLSGQARVEATLNEVKEAYGLRLTDLEEEQRWQSRRQWYITAAVVPVTGAIHALANKLGWRI